MRVPCFRLGPLGVERVLELTSSTPLETERIGSLLGQRLIPGDVVALAGELGSGKTVLVRGIAQGMGVDMRGVASPSFTLINEYTGTVPLFHIDLYRLEGENDLYEIGYDEYVGGGGVAVIEWADKVPNMVPKEALWIVLRYIEAERRQLCFQTQGMRFREVIEKLERDLL